MGDKLGQLAAIVLAAGKGTRIGHPELPKVLLPLRGRPLLAYVLDAVTALQPERLLVVVGFRGDQVAAFVRTSFPQAELVWQLEQRGTGHAVAQTEPVLRDFTGDVLIVTGDTPFLRGDTLQAFVGFHRRHQYAVSVLTAHMPEPAGYGRIVRDAEGRLLRIVEDRDATDAERALTEVNTGIIAARAPLLFALLPLLQPHNAQREYYLTDIVTLCREQGYPVGGYCAEEWEQFLGINTLEDYHRAEQLVEQLPAVGTVRVAQ
jgi:UDP-N-acetylglucosamine diphosphorylase/glucosamine-1-phosphate N-acetyltransferase